MLEDAVRDLLARGEPGLICVQGIEGRGKSVALASLEALRDEFPQLTLLDEPKSEELEPLLRADASRTIVYSARFAPDRPHLAVLGLNTWTRDDLIEYVLHAAPPACKALFQRMGNHHAPEFRGAPVLWSMALEAMAADETIEDPCDGVRRELTRLLDESGHQDQLLSTGLSNSLELRDAADDLLVELAEELEGTVDREPLLPLLQQPFVQNYLAAERILRDLRNETAGAYLSAPLPPYVLRELSLHEETLNELRPFLESLLRDLSERHATVASILHSSDSTWLGEFLRRNAKSWHPLPDLQGSRLDGARVENAPATGLKLTKASCSGSSWCGANLRLGELQQADFRGALFRGADLTDAQAEGADFTGADLRSVHARRANMKRAALGRATLSRGDFVGTSFDGAVLNHARLSRAVLRQASLAGADLQHAILRNADLTAADLAGQDLRTADLNGAKLVRASLEQANLEGIQVDEANWEQATLHQAHLTGSCLHGANLKNCTLHDAELADVDWEGADLRGAAFDGASFHLGSTRSGTLNGEPSQGTRTGYYTEALTETSFRPIEEIRKANLSGADLRGAHVLDTDWYLVDLREAQYTPEQRAHFTCCGALL